MDARGGVGVHYSYAYILARGVGLRQEHLGAPRGIRRKASRSRHQLRRHSLACLLCRRGGNASLTLEIVDTLAAMAETVVDIEIFAITPRIAARYAHRAADYHGLDQRTCYKVTTSSGEIGWGESRGSPELAGQGHDVYGPRVGAYHHLLGMGLVEAIRNVPAAPRQIAELWPRGNRNHDAGMECALYDALGKHLKVPVHALLGRKLRDWVPVAAWTTPCAPADFQADVQRAVDDGYMAM